jgi:hypothetical protein
MNCNSTSSYPPSAAMRSIPLNLFGYLTPSLS